MNCCRETVEMAVILGNRRELDYVLEQYVAGGPVLSLSKEHPRTPGRTGRYTVAAGNS
jgi:hypothetical protein